MDQCPRIRGAFKEKIRVEILEWFAENSGKK